MRAKNILIHIFIFLIILNTINAQEFCGASDSPCGDNWDKFDYSNPKADIFKIPDEKVDVSKENFEKINFSQN